MYGSFYFEWPFTFLTQRQRRQDATKKRTNFAVDLLSNHQITMPTKTYLPTFTALPTFTVLPTFTAFLLDGLPRDCNHSIHWFETTLLNHYSPPSTHIPMERSKNKNGWWTIKSKLIFIDHGLGNITKLTVHSNRMGRQGLGLTGAGQTSQIRKENRLKLGLVQTPTIVNYRSSELRFYPSTHPRFCGGCIIRASPGQSMVMTSVGATEVNSRSDRVLIEKWVYLWLAG